MSFMYRSMSIVPMSIVPSVKYRSNAGGLDLHPSKPVPSTPLLTHHLRRNPMKRTHPVHLSRFSSSSPPFISPVYLLPSLPSSLPPLFSLPSLHLSRFSSSFLPSLHLFVSLPSRQGGVSEMPSKVATPPRGHHVEPGWISALLLKMATPPGPRQWGTPAVQAGVMQPR